MGRHSGYIKRVLFTEPFLRFIAHGYELSYMKYPFVNIVGLVFLLITSYVNAGIDNHHFLKKVDPEYPALMEKLGVCGEVTLEFDADSHGVPKNIQVQRGSHELFDMAAISALKESKVIPISPTMTGELFGQTTHYFFRTASECRKGSNSLWKATRRGLTSSDVEANYCVTTQVEKAENSGSTAYSLYVKNQCDLDINVLACFHAKNMQFIGSDKCLETIFIQKKSKVLYGKVEASEGVDFSIERSWQACLNKSCIHGCAGVWMILPRQTLVSEITGNTGLIAGYCEIILNDEEVEESKPFSLLN